MAYPRVDFTEPAPYGYLYLGWCVDPPTHAPFVRRSAKRQTVIEECRRLAGRLEAQPEVVAATVYEAVVIPPVEGSPRFDVLALIQTSSPDVIPAIETTADLVMPATNIRRIGNVDQPRSGAFLFNHFTATDPERALAVWEEVAGWFTHRAGVEASALLRPSGDAPYVFVNHVRLPSGPIRFLLNFARPSFRSSVAEPLRANGIGNAPVICRPAG